jgi:hypothetical protein
LGQLVGHDIKGSCELNPMKHLILISSHLLAGAPHQEGARGNELEGEAIRTLWPKLEGRILIITVTSTAAPPIAILISRGFLWILIITILTSTSKPRKTITIKILRILTEAKKSSIIFDRIAFLSTYIRDIASRFTAQQKNQHNTPSSSYPSWAYLARADS